MTTTWTTDVDPFDGLAMFEEEAGGDPFAELEGGFDPFADDFDGMGPDFAAAADIGTLDDAVFERVITGGVEATIETQAADPFLGAVASAALRRVGQAITKRLAAWARGAVGQRLQRYGQRAVQAALRVLQEVSRRTVSDVLAHVRQRPSRATNLAALWTFAQQRFWHHLRQALAGQGIRITA